MLAPTSDLLRAGIGLKLGQIKLATRSYLRDRTNQATGTMARSNPRRTRVPIERSVT